MRILVVGGTRFIGPYVVRELHAGGHEVGVFHRGRTSGALPEGTHEILADRQALRDRRSGEVAALRAFAPAVVVDMIAMTKADAEATVATFAGVAERLVVASSMDVYRPYSRLHREEDGDPLPTPLDEDGPLRVLRYPYRSGEVPVPGDLDLHNYEKIEVEQAARDEPSLPATVLRLPAVYGPNDANHRLADPLRRMDDGREVIALPATYAAWRWTQGYVEDVAHAIALAAVDARGAGRTYNVGPAETPSVHERIEVLGRAAGWTGRVEVFPDGALPPFAAGAVDVRHHLECDTGRIRRELGYEEVVSLEEGLRRTAEWERAERASRAHLPPLDYVSEDAALARWRAVNG